MKEIPQKIKSGFMIRAASTDFSALTDIKVYVQQGGNTLAFSTSENANGSIEVINTHVLQIIISKAAAALLVPDIPGKFQVFGTDAYGFPQRSKVYTFSIAEVLPEDGYGI